MSSGSSSTKHQRNLRKNLLDSHFEILPSKRNFNQQVSSKIPLRIPTKPNARSQRDDVMRKPDEHQNETRTRFRQTRRGLSQSMRSDVTAFRADVTSGRRAKDVAFGGKRGGTEMCSKSHDAESAAPIRVSRKTQQTTHSLKLARQSWIPQLKHPLPHPGVPCSHVTTRDVGVQFRSSYAQRWREAGSVRGCAEGADDQLDYC